ncbi:Polcalcin Phl p 7 [Dendrobium catenatum]|uniref:Polcalcin Phl p 7 n=1 Tax=Dendrobium catenatum TaxID=906689 RepID=A0A2I0W5D2_9ASPA|nr:Polcalcin Phl p 7 [Dendrobium catenatum]
MSKDEEGLTPEMERMFKKFDANGDGKVSKSELAEALRTLGSTSSDDVQHIMAELDTNGDGFIDFHEFASFCRNNSGLMNDVSKAF